MKQAQLDSWEKTLESLAERQRDIVNFFTEGPSGASFTAWEIANARGLLVHAVRPRLTELEAMGVLEAAGKRYYGPTNRHESAYKLADRSKFSPQPAGVQEELFI